MTAVPWEPHGVDSLRDISSGIPLETMDLAFELFPVCAIDQDIIRPRIAASVEWLIINGRLEEAPSDARQRNAIKQLLEPLRLANAAITQFDEATTKVLAAAALHSNAWPLDDGLRNGRIKIGNGKDALIDMINWCELAGAALEKTPTSLGRPREEALFACACELAEIFRDITGRRPARTIQSYADCNADKLDATEKGKFRKFANVLLAPLDMKISDDMAKRVIAKLRAEEKSKKLR